MRNKSKFLVSSLYFKLLLAAGLVFVFAVGLLAWQASYDARLQGIVQVSHSQLTQMALARSQPAVLGAATQLKQTELRIYTPKQPQPILPYTETPPVYHRIKTAEPVVFITIDDGVVADEAGFIELQNHGAVATLFLNDEIVRGKYKYFERWQATGSSIQNHALSHQFMERLTLDEQRNEICENAKRMHRAFGTSTPLFRPPFGGYNADTRKAAGECGVKAIVHWSVEVKAGKVHYQQGERLRPGDIILLHFTKDLKADLQALFAAAQEQNLQIGRLEDWLR